MPEKVLPTEPDFREFYRKMCGFFGFRPLQGMEIRKEMRWVGAQSPHRRFGHEYGFSFHAHGLTVVVWTTWLGEEGRARDEDAGWVLIRDGRKSVYFIHPVHRTQNFFLTLLRHARVNRKRALNRPLCPKCHDRMCITRGEGLKARYWRCSPCYRAAVDEVERKKFCVDWDSGLNKQERQWVQALRRKRAKQRKEYERESRAKGKEPVPAVLRRRPWTTRPTSVRS